MFDDPAIDPRTPDIALQPDYGVIYTGGKKKVSEHGGFSHDDTNVILLLSHPSFESKTVKAEVGTAQVAPSILEALHIDPRELRAVRVEGTGVLPAVDFK